jgi:hypothetical protein
MQAFFGFLISNKKADLIMLNDVSTSKVKPINPSSASTQTGVL